MAPPQLFKLRASLREALTAVGATGNLFTANEVVKYLGKYIEQRKLFDTKNMKTVVLKGDKLESIFGVEQFEVQSSKDVWTLIFPCLTPATKKEIEAHHETSKNQDKDILENDDFKIGKLEHWWMSRLPWWYFIDKKNEEQDNATGSFQDTSTVLVADTDYSSNERSPASTGSVDRFSVEFEPDSEASESYGNDTDDTEPVVSEDETDSVLAPLMQSEDDTVTSTSGTTDISIDCDIPLEDHWRCGECALINIPTVGYCQRCWKLRKNWLPDNLGNLEPAMSRSFTMPVPEVHSIAKPTDDVAMQRSQSLPVSRGIDIPDCRSRTKSCDISTTQKSQSSESQTTLIDETTTLSRKRCLNEDETNDTTNENSEPPCKKSNNLIKPYIPKNIISSANVTNTTASGILTPSSSSSSDGTLQSKYKVCQPGVCNICRSNPNNAIFLHGKTSHQYCCFKCASKLRKRGKPCPVCRQPILLVVKNFIYTM